MKIDVLVVLYNCKLSDSSTIQSLLKSNLNSINLNIIIWNNGPCFLTEDDIKQHLNNTKQKAISTSIFQDVRNLSLSKIYNQFISNNSYDYFVIFDQDSEIDPLFMQNILNNPKYMLICPAIYARQHTEKQCFPADFKDIEKVVSTGEFELCNTRTINSGTALSKELIDTLIKEHGYVFDDKFAFYHTDHRLFDLINETNSLVGSKGLCIGIMHHDMTCELSAKSMSERAKLEIAYAKMLMRIYRNQNPKPQRLRNLVYSYKVKKLDNLNLSSFFKLIKCVLTKEHPRSINKIEQNIKPTHTNHIQ